MALGAHLAWADSLAGRNDKTLKTGASERLVPSGCVIWMIVTPTLDVATYLWFGSAPGEPLPHISDFQVTGHSKGNAEGRKTERPNHRIVPRGKFEQLSSLDGVLERLFGPIG